MKKGREELYRRPSLVWYRLAQLASFFVSTIIFRRKFIRNEIKNAEGPFVVIANHQAALDFVNLIGAAKRPMSFVLSWSFYSTLPIKGVLDRMGIIPKQQFQSSVLDMKRMKAVIDKGEALVIYPAGLMCEDGLSTPIPQATYKFLKWLGADVYVARSAGSYFVMPKWAKGFRPGRTEMDIYKLFDRDELASLSLDEVKTRTDEALLYDAYREQESIMYPYAGGQNIEGLEKVLYMCPHCLGEHTMAVRDRNTIYCRKCGYAQQSDRYGFLHRLSGHGREIRYVSDWNRFILEEQANRIDSGEDSVSTPVRIKMVEPKEHRFADAGEGILSLDQRGFHVCAVIGGKVKEFDVPIAGIPTLPFGPGKYLEIQRDREIYRCVPQNGNLVMKMINMLKILHVRNREGAAEQERGSRVI